jgi:uncharacterized membrane protein YhaH (DUF805 family)
LPSSANNVLDEFRVRGRLSRAGFWLRHFSIVPIGLWLAIAAAETAGSPYDLPLVAAMVLLMVSIWGRRLHDRARSAWWLLATLVPVLGPLFLMVECGLRGTAPTAAKFGPEPGTRDDYVSVGESVGAART